MQTKRANLVIPLLLLSVSGVYYYLLSSKIFTWVFTSGDAGDWLTQLRWWVVPHVFGSPFYISLIHAVNYLPFGDDVFKVTLLSIIPGAVTMMLTYLIALKLTGDELKSLAAALVLMGAVMFMSQATVIEEYAMMAMLFAMFYYFYLCGHKILSMLSLGLLTATHVIGVVVFLLFLVLVIIKYRETRKWVGALVVYGCVAFLPYLLILGLMNADTPKLLVGGLSPSGVIEYLFSNSTSSVSLAVVSFPERLLEAVRVVVVSLGLAIVPLFKIKGKLGNKLGYFVLSVCLFCAWFYLTNLFFSTWKYVAVILPAVCGLVAVGLTNMKRIYTVVVIGCAVLLIGVNAIVANPNTLAYEKPLATEYTKFLQDLPDGTGILTSRGGAYGFALGYTMSQGKDLVPIPLSDDLDASKSLGLRGYLKWVRDTYGVEGDNYLELAQYLLVDGRDVYFPNILEPWKVTFDELGFNLELIDSDNEIYQVTLK